MVPEICPAASRDRDAVCSADGLMIGVDGGGSKTEFVLFDADGTAADRLCLGGANPNSAGIDGSAAVMAEGIDRLRAKCGGIRGVFIGCAGYRSGDSGAKVARILMERYPGVTIRCDTDIANVFASAGEDPPPVAAICGTGTVVYSRSGGALRRYTGWGHLLDRGGSGFFIGREGITAALEQAEGLGPDTVLADLVRARLGAQPGECLSEFYNRDVSYIASFAGCVFEAYGMGDEVAGRILRDGAERLSEVIRRAVRDVPGARSVLLAGGIVENNAVFRDMVGGRTGLETVLPALSQAEGACVLCARECGLDAGRMYSAFLRGKERA
jgi:N-acetylglucosamine kinase-like BadF-type ATPase